MSYPNRDQTSLENSQQTQLRKPVSSSIRPKNFLTYEQVKSIANAAASFGRHSCRDYTLIRMLFCHALKVSEASNLQWQQIDFKSKALFITPPDRPKRPPHSLDDSEIEILRQLKDEYPDSDYVFASELKNHLTSASIRHIVVRAGRNAGLDFPISPHMLRNSAFYYLQQQAVPIPAMSQYLRVGIKTTARVVSEYAQDTSCAQNITAIQWDI